MMQITVRWWDGYVEVINNVTEWHAGPHLLLLHFEDGKIRHIPLQQVRWFDERGDERLR